jgi:hypothetical protein
MLDKAWGNYGLMGAYLIDKGEKVTVEEMDVEVNRGYNPKRAETYDKIIDIVGLDNLADMSNRQLIDTYGDQLAEEIPEHRDVPDGKVKEERQGHHAESRHAPVDIGSVPFKMPFHRGLLSLRIPSPVPVPLFYYSRSFPSSILDSRDDFGFRFRVRFAFPNFCTSFLFSHTTPVM